MKTLYYIANMRMPNEKAHALQVVKTCAALAASGMEVTLLVPNRHNAITEDVFSYFGIEKTFSVKKLPSLDLIILGSFGFLLGTLTFAWSLFFFLLRRNKGSIIYCRGEIGVFISFFSPARKLFWETHEKPRNLFFYRHLLKKASGIITITHCYKKELEALEVSAERIHVAPDGVDISQFSIEVSKEEARKKLSLPLEKPIVLYTGSDLLWKGVSVLEEAAAKIPETSVVLVGPKKKEKVASNIVYAGRKSHREIPLWLAAADALVLTGTLTDAHSSCYTSPLKLFEYMASNRPIIAPALPAFKEILSGDNACLTAPDNVAALAEGIKKVLEDKDYATGISIQAYRDVIKYSWGQRALGLISFIQEKL